MDVPFIGTATARSFFEFGQPAIVNDNASTQAQTGPATLSEESPAKAKPLEAAKSRVANLLHAFAPKKKATPDEPEAPPPAQETPVKAVIGSDRAALFLDSKGNIVAAQPRCAGFFGRFPDELSGLNLKDLLKSGFDEEISNILTKGQQASEMSFHVLAQRKDGSEFPTQLSFKFLPEDFGFCWTVFVQAPPGFELQQIIPTTETATQNETSEPKSGEKSPAPPARSRSRNPEQLASKLEAAQNECKRLERVKFESEKRLRQMQTDYGNRVIQLEQDLSNEREINEQISKRLEAQEQSFSVQVKGMQKIKQQHPESAAAPEQPNAELDELQKRQKTIESEATALRQERDALRAKLLALQKAEPQGQGQTGELAAKLEKASTELQALRKDAEENESGRKQLKADLEKEREATKLSQKKAEELHAQFQKLKSASEQAEARVRDSAAKCSDWEKKVADLSKSADELSKSHAAGKSAGAQSAQRVKELEQQLKDANANLATGKTEAEKQTAARQKLEAENRTLTEAGTKTKADLDKEREAIKLARKKEEELNAEIQKSQKAAEQSATQSKDLEKKAAELKKNFDELTKNHATEKNAAAQSAQRVKDLEQQLKRSGDDLTAKKTELEKQTAARQKLETENRTLTEANSRTNADLDMERDAHKLFRQKAEDLSAQVKNLQHAGEQAETRIRESAAQSKDWEKKAAELKKSVDELTKSHSAEKSSATQSAQRVKELEPQLKRANDDLAASKAEMEKQTSARQKLETEHRNLTEAGAKTKAELDKERDANKLSRQKAEELSAQLQKVQSTAAQSAQRVKELEQQLKRSSDELAARKAEAEMEQSARKQLEAVNRELTEANAKAKAELAVSVNKDSVFEKRANELEHRVREGVSALAKATTDLQSERVERERAEKCASLATTHSQQINEMLDRQLELERGYRSKIAELEKTMHDRGDDLARASAALRRETKERQIAQKQSRLVSDMGNRLESNLASLDDAKKVFEASLQEKDEQLQIVERSLKEAQASLEKESTERRRLDVAVADTKRQFEKQSAESKVEISRLQAALDLLELQRKRLEGDLLRSSDDAKSAEQGIGATLENLRLELRQAVEDLRRSACSLLESKVTDEQKRVVETVLEKALFLQVTLNAGAKPETASPPQGNGRKAESKKAKG